MLNRQGVCLSPLYWKMKAPSFTPVQCLVVVAATDSNHNARILMDNGHFKSSTSDIQKIEIVIKNAVKIL